MPEPERHEARWLLQPPGPNEIQIHVAVGEGAEVSPEFRKELEGLITRLMTPEEDVQGFRTLPPCGELEECKRFDCSLGKCQSLLYQPCLANIQCRIQSIMLY